MNVWTVFLFFDFSNKNQKLLGSKKQKKIGVFLSFNEFIKRFFLSFKANFI